MRAALATALLLLCAYALFLRYGPAPAEARTQSQWQDNLMTMEQYFRAPGEPGVVLVGSSLTRKLDFAGDRACVHNLALGGDSLFTGLAAVARAGHTPRMVLVEINIPDRGPNQALIDQSDSPLLALSPIFYTENKPANRIYSYLYQLKKNRSDPPVAEAVFQNSLALQRSAYARPIAPENLAAHMGDIRRRVQALEAGGVHVVFFELPVNPELEQTPYALQVRAAFKREFPGNTLVAYEELSRGLALHTLDGVHLETHEAAAVVARLRPYYQSACARG